MNACDFVRATTVVAVFAVGPALAAEPPEAALPCNTLCRNWMGLAEAPGRADPTAPMELVPQVLTPASATPAQEPSLAASVLPVRVPLPPVRSAVIGASSIKLRVAPNNQPRIVQTPAPASSLARVSPDGEGQSPSGPTPHAAVMAVVMPPPAGPLAASPDPVARASTPFGLIAGVPGAATAAPSMTASGRPDGAVVFPVVRPEPLVVAIATPPAPVAPPSVPPMPVEPTRPARPVRVADSQPPAVPAVPTVPARQSPAPMSGPPPFDVIGALILATPPLAKAASVTPIAHPVP